MADLGFSQSAALKTFEEIRRTTPVAPPPRPAAVSDAFAAYHKRKRAKALLARMYEGLRLYEPLPLGTLFHQCNATWRLADGSNRAGKTLACCAEDAYVLTGTDPYDKYPKENGNAYFVGLERKHLRLMYLTMFIEGAFKILKDEHTGMWRSVRWDRNNPLQLQAYDEAYREKWKDAPPLIPPRMVKRIEFDQPEVPRLVSMKNGWRGLWQSAAGEPDQGWHWNHAHFDEEMPRSEFFSETHRGLTRIYETIQHRPKAIWSATSQVANIELADLRDRADADPESDAVRRFIFLLANMPYIPDQAKEEFAEGLSEIDRMTRVHGIPASQAHRYYATYNPAGDAENGTGHGCEPFDIDPRTYARYVIIDPAINHCTTLFVAIDPLNQYLTVYDGFEMSGQSTRTWAAEVKRRQNGVKFEAAIMDEHRGKCRREGRDVTTVAHEFSMALKEYDVEFRRLGPMDGFFMGCADVDARIKCLQGMLDVRGGHPFGGTCKLRVMRGVAPLLDKQMRRAQTDPKNPNKAFKNPKIPQDWRDCLEYAAAGNLMYFEPEVIEEKDNAITAFDMFKKKRSRNLQRTRERSLSTIR